jgi:hypothetical protein
MEDQKEIDLKNLKKFFSLYPDDNMEKYYGAICDSCILKLALEGIKYPIYTINFSKFDLSKNFILRKKK